MLAATFNMPAENENPRMNWTKLPVAIAIAATLAAPATAYADDAVPTTDEVVAIMAKLTDPGIPAANKSDIVTPGFAPEEGAVIDDHLNRTGAFGYLPYDFVITDIEPAPNNFAGATVNTTGGYRHRTHGPIVLVNQGGRWLITHDTAMTELNLLWNATERPPPYAK
jgi:hypothetical protein